MADETYFSKINCVSSNKKRGLIKVIYFPNPVKSTI